MESSGGSTEWAIETPAPLDRDSHWWRDWREHPAVGDIVGLRLTTSPGHAEEEIRRLTHLPRMRRLTLDVSTDGNELLRVLPLLEMTRPNLAHLAVRNEGLPSLASLTQLEELDLSGNRVSDRDISQLPALLELERLCLLSTDVGDEGLKALRKLEKLTHLEVGPLGTDGGIGEIVRIRKLRSLYFHESPVTNAAMDRLMRDLPDLNFVDLFYTEVTGDKMQEMQNRGIHVQAAY